LLYKFQHKTVSINATESINPNFQQKERRKQKITKAMWKASLNKAIHECRFYLKPGAENHGAWNFVINKLSEFRMLNQDTFFHVHEIPDAAESDSHVHLMYKGQGSLSDVILTKGLTFEQFEEVRKLTINFNLKTFSNPM